MISKCNCGFPQHLLIPKGIPEGFPAQLFVMVSDWNVDKVSINIPYPASRISTERCMIATTIRYEILFPIKF